MTAPPHMSPDEEFAALVQRAPAPAGPARPPWSLVAVLVLSGLGILAAVFITWPRDVPAAPTGWPDPPRPTPTAAPTAPAQPPLAPTPCTGKACAVREAHPDWPFAVCDAVADGRVALGMSGAQVKAAWGDPQTTDGDRWCYAEACASGVRFAQDRVVELLGR